MRVKGLAVVVAVATAAVLAFATGCGTAKESSPQDADARVVFAASSLKQSFTTIGEQFKNANPGVAVNFSFAGSSDLVTKLGDGAKADVLASADAKNMAKAEAANLTVGDPVKFATNVLTIAVPKGNPKGITSFKDLARDDLKVVVCGPQTGCGSATERVERLTGVELNPAGTEPVVSDVIDKVASGEADAGVVYVTDVAGSGGRVAGVEFPEANQAINTYPIVTIRAAAHEDLARKFIAFVSGEAGRKVLDAAGFGKP
jgi:molybdate transport system substrate-binding protein